MAHPGAASAMLGPKVERADRYGVPLGFRRMAAVEIAASIRTTTATLATERIDGNMVLSSLPSRVSRTLYGRNRLGDIGNPQVGLTMFGGATPARRQDGAAAAARIHRT